MKRRVICLLLCLVMAIGMVVPVSASQKDDAQFLYELGLFKGSGTLADGSPDFALDRSLSRQEAVVMLVRLLGKEQEALEGNWSLPFTDVAQWARPYVGYAYEKGLTNGLSSTEFGGSQAVTATQYITFVLRALHYDSSKHFAWNAAWEKSDEIGLTNGEYSSANNEAFDRGDAAYISRQALTTCLFVDDATLIDSLVSSGAVDKDRAIELGLAEEDDVYVLYARELMTQGKDPVTVSLDEKEGWIKPNEYFEAYGLFIGSSVDVDNAMSLALMDYVEVCYDGDYNNGYFPGQPARAGWNGDADAFIVTDGMGTIIAYGIRTDTSTRDFTMYYCTVDTKPFVAERVEEMKELMASLTELDCQGTYADGRVAFVVKNMPENAAYITMEWCLSSGGTGENYPDFQVSVSVEVNLPRNIEWSKKGRLDFLPVQAVNYADFTHPGPDYNVTYFFVMIWDKDMNPLGYKMVRIEI